MVDKSNAYGLVIADLKRQRADIDAMIAKLEAMAGSQPIPLSDSTVASLPNEENPVPLQTENNPYLGMSIADATIALLRKTRRAMGPTEIVNELEAGGLILSGNNKPNTVNTVLARRRDRLGDLVKPKRGQWGLKEWYPGRNFGKSESSNSKEETATSEATTPNRPRQTPDRPPIDPEDPEAGL